MKLLIGWEAYINQWYKYLSPKDEKYDHLDPAEMEKVEKYITEAMNWLNSKMNAQNKLSLTQDPVVKVAEILTKSKVKKKNKKSLYMLLSNKFFFRKILASVLS